MAAPYKGQCLCGAVRLAISSEPVAVLCCYCRHCQVGAGSAYQVLAKFAAADVQVTAEDAITRYTLTDTSSGHPKEKAFCNVCGCPLWTAPLSAKDKYRVVRTALLENGLQLGPGNEIFVKNRPAWARPANVPQWEGTRR